MPWLRPDTIMLSAVLTCVAGCEEAQAPYRTGGDIVVLGGGETESLVVVDVGTSKVIARPGPMPRYKDAFALAPDSAILYINAVGDSGRELIRLDTRSFRVVSRDAMSVIETRSDIGELSIHGGRAIAVFPKGTKLAVAQAYRDGVAGIVILDAQSWEPIDFIYPLYVEPFGMERLAPSSEFPSGALLVIGAREDDVQPSLDWLFVMDPLTHRFTDSVAIAPPANDSRGTLRQVLTAPDGQTVYVVGRSFIYRYDLLRGEVIATVGRPSRGLISLSPDGTTLYVPDPGDGFDWPGSGLLFVYDADLNSEEPIDLSEAAFDGTAPVTGGVGVSLGSDLVYVVAGTVSRGPLYGPQPAKLLIVDAVARRLIETVDLNGWAFWAVFVVPPH